MSAPRTRFRFKAPHRTPKPLTNASARETTEPTTESTTDTASPPNTGHENTAEKEITFLESLFDALSSASAAEYWAAVYGQPIHIYPRPAFISSDIEYAAYVQAKLWSKTREGIEAEARDRARRRAKKEKEDEDARAKWRDHARRIAKEEKRLEREKERLRAKILDGEWQGKVREYLDAWVDRKDIPWPAATDWGSAKLETEQIEHFFVRLADIQDRSFEDVIKLERVRWHPDKIMQRFGVKNDSEEGREELRKVNEVWRAIDGIWRRLREDGHG